MNSDAYFIVTEEDGIFEVKWRWRDDHSEIVSWFAEQGCHWGDAKHLLSDYNEWRVFTTSSRLAVMAKMRWGGAA